MPSAATAADIERVVAGLHSFVDGDRATFAVIGLGPRAVPALQALLFEREPSGLYQPRCRAARALAALRAFDVLAAFLRRETAIPDAVERLGEEAVINAAAEGLSHLREGWVFDLLLAVARRHPSGALANAIGSFRRAEAIPVLVEHLIEDEARPAAETALLALGPAARPALLRAARTAVPSAPEESPSSRRRRGSTLKLLAEIGVTREEWRALAPLVDDPDATIALRTCVVGLTLGDSPAIWRRLSTLLRAADHADAARICALLSAPVAKGEWGGDAIP